MGQLIDQFIEVYEISFNLRIDLSGHSMSNVQSEEGGKTVMREQPLFDGTITDALSGSISKHYLASNLAEIFEEENVPLCPACSRRDSRRSFALAQGETDRIWTINKIIQDCGICDCQGFLIPAKNSDDGKENSGRGKRSKHSLIEISFALALENSHRKRYQMFQREGLSKATGLMMYHRPGRSARYGICVRYKSAGIGVDTECWNLIIKNQNERLMRHRAILAALRDLFLSPSGAMTSAMLPHFSGMQGAVLIRKTAGRAPIYSPLDSDYLTQLKLLSIDNSEVRTFDNISDFNQIMRELIAFSQPKVPKKFISLME